MLMAKRSPRSEANEIAPATPSQPGKSGRKRLETVPERDTTSRSMGSEPSEEDIRLRAYQRYLERGAGDGQDFDDWLEAERELKKQ